MKNLFKLIISLFVCGLVLLTGCTSTPKSSLPSELKAPNTNYPNKITILAPGFFSGAAVTDPDKQQWLDEMSARYGVQFDILTNYTTDSGEFDHTATDQVHAMLQGDTTFKGIFSIFASGADNSTVKMCLEYDSIMPLEDYLADNPIWNSLPEDFKSIFESDGHIYAIPASVSVGVQKARMIHNEAIADTGITVTDLQSFHDFALAYFKKTAYPGGNCAISDVTDILNAFGLYPGNDSLHPFSYDPKEDCYTDWLTKPAAVDALEYLRELYNLKGLYYESSSSASSAFDYGLLASEYVPYYDDNNCAEVMTLNPEYPQVIFKNTSGFALGKDTPQPKETVNLLVDMLFGSEQSYLECWLGSSDNYVLNSDGSLTVKMVKDSAGKSVPPCTPNLAGGLSELFPFTDENIIYCPADDTGTDSAALLAKNKARIKMFNDSLENGSLVEIPPEVQLIRSDTYGEHIYDVSNSYYKCCRDAIVDPTLTVQQVLDDYKAKMLNMGGNTMLDEINAAIGKKTAYYYG